MKKKRFGTICIIFLFLFCILLPYAVMRTPISFHSTQIFYDSYDVLDYIYSIYSQDHDFADVYVNLPRNGRILCCANINIYREVLGIIQAANRYLSPEDQLQLRLVKYSSSDLVEFSHAIITFYKEISSQAEFPFHAIARSTQYNCITVETVKITKELKQAIWAIVPRNAVRFEVSPPIVPT